MSNSKVREFVSRIESLETEKRGLADDIRSIYDEAQGAGIVPAALRKLVAKRKKDSAKQQLIDGLVAQYELEL